MLLPPLATLPGAVMFVLNIMVSVRRLERYFGEEELEEVGVLMDSLVTVAVTVSLAAELVGRLMPKLWYAVLVKALAAQPYCVRTILS